LTVTDVNGNVSTVDADVTVEDNVDPIAVSQDITVQLDATGNGSTTAALVDNGSNDACGIASLSVSQTDFDCSHVGINTVTLTVTDVNGNVSTVDADVTVEDNVDPIAISQDVTVQLDATGSGSTTAALVDNGSNDACGIATLIVSQTDFDCSHVGTNTVTLTVTDVNGNVSTVDADVTVEDNVDPTAISQDVTVQLDAAGNGSTTAALVDNGSNDACGIDTLIVSQTNFDCSHVGINTVTLTVTDVNGNVSTVDADVTVEDNVDPIAISQDVTVQLDATGNGSTTAALVDNGSNDACGIASLTLDKTSFDCSNVGIPNPVILTVTDVNGNSSTATANVTVEDDICPTVEVKLEPIEGMLKKNKGCFTVVITPEDNCSIADVVADLNGHPVANGQIVELKKKKKYKVKLKKEGSHDDDSSGDDDDSSRGRRRCKPDVKFEGPDFTLTATVTDSSGNGGGLGECNKGLDTDNGSDTDRDVYVFPSKHDGHSHDRHNHDGDSKSNDDDNSGKRNK